MPASEAQYPDDAINCREDLVLGYWELDTDGSKLFFKLQKEIYATEKSPGSSALVGPNWTMRGNTELVEQLRKSLGGSIL
jgi:hypothetical protein